MQRLSLAEQIAQLEDVAPADIDPEDAQVTGVDPCPKADTVTYDGAARAHYINVSPSSLRKLHEGLSDPKYEGTKTSRNVILGASEDNKSDSEDDEAETGSHASEASMDTAAKNGVDVQITASVQAESPGTSNDPSSNLRKTREEDQKKGRAISRQIALWDSLLDARIRLQKSVTSGNCLLQSSKYPTNGQLPQDSSDHQVRASLMKMLEEAQLLSNEIFHFQEYLLLVNESIQPPPRKRRRNAESGYLVTDYAEELREASHAVSKLEYCYHSHLVQTLDKWSSKIQAVAPSVLLPSNRNAFSRTAQHIKSASQLIDETLADHSKALARTRIYRGKGSKTGVDIWDKEDPEVFDDTDFYHQLLRDIIDTRGDGKGGNDGWMTTQKGRKAKKVDTKASKGRKLRYEVHEKIQNFMVPVWTQGSWHEEQIDELFASLLGKGFESAMQEAGEVAEEPPLTEEVALGFHVFG